MNETIEPVRYSLEQFAFLVAEARSEGIGFMQRFHDGWMSGSEKFDRPGEILLGASIDCQLVGVGGITLDPYAPAPGLGRVRHVYVRAEFRNQGIGERLLRRIIAYAPAHFTMLRLSTRERAARLYERLGFVKDEAFKQTHVLKL